MPLPTANGRLFATRFKLPPPGVQVARALESSCLLTQRRILPRHPPVEPLPGNAMKPHALIRWLIPLRVLAWPLVARGADNEPPPGFVSLFNGHDLAGWQVPEGDGGHWKVADGVIDYDAESEAKARDKSLWSEREFGDFVL